MGSEALRSRVTKDTPAETLKQANLYRSDQQFQTEKKQVKILIAGDSHPRADVYPKLLENSFIVAYGGENTILTYYRLSNYNLMI